MPGGADDPPGCCGARFDADFAKIIPYLSVSVFFCCFFSREFQDKRAASHGDYDEQGEIIGGISCSPFLFREV